MIFIIVDFPEPLYPTKAIYSPFLIFNDKFLITGVLEEGYLKVTLSNYISPLILISDPLDSST